jgi:hypothetical protein
MVLVAGKVQVIQVGLRCGIEPQGVNTRAVVAVLIRVLIGFGDRPVDCENRAIKAVFAIASPGTLVALTSGTPRPRVGNKLALVHGFFVIFGQVCTTRQVATVARCKRFVVTIVFLMKIFGAWIAVVAVGLAVGMYVMIVLFNKNAYIQANIGYIKQSKQPGQYQNKSDQARVCNCTPTRNFPSHGWLILP